MHAPLSPTAPLNTSTKIHSSHSPHYITNHLNRLTRCSHRHNSPSRPASLHTPAPSLHQLIHATTSTLTHSTTSTLLHQLHPLTSIHVTPYISSPFLSMPLHSLQGPNTLATPPRHLHTPSITAIQHPRLSLTPFPLTTHFHTHPPLSHS